MGSRWGMIILSKEIGHAYYKGHVRVHVRVQNYQKNKLFKTLSKFSMSVLTFIQVYDTYVKNDLLVPSFVCNNPGRLKTSVAIDITIDPVWTNTTQHGQTLRRKQPWKFW